MSTQNGQLVTANNLPVLGNGGPMSVPPGAEVTIGKDGTVSALIPGDPPTAIAVVDQLKLVNPDPATLSRSDDGLFRTADGDPAEADRNVVVAPASLEGSNVNPVAAMVEMITNARQFQMQTKLMESADQNEQRPTSCSISASPLSHALTQDITMNRSLYIAKTGLERAADAARRHFEQPRQRQHVRLQALARGVRGPAVPDGAPAGRELDAADRTLPTGLQLGTGVRPVATERIYTQGNLQQTSNSLDVAINGQGFFQVQMPDGTTAYTRDGSFQTNAQGQLVTSSGYPVQPAITIPQNATVDHDRQRRHGHVTQQGSTANVTGRRDPARELHQPGRPRCARREPVLRDRFVGHAERHARRA